MKVLLTSAKVDNDHPFGYDVIVSYDEANQVVVFEIGGKDAIGIQVHELVDALKAFPFPFQRPLGSRVTRYPYNQPVRGIDISPEINASIPVEKEPLPDSAVLAFLYHLQFALQKYQMHSEVQYRYGNIRVQTGEGTFILNVAKVEEPPDEE